MSEWLDERTRETRALAASHKRGLAEGLRQGVAVAAHELLALDRLEAKLDNRERIKRVREHTRSRGPAGP